METTTENKVSVLKDMATLGIAVAEGYAQQADGTLPPSLSGSMKTLSERLAEGMSNEFYRMKDVYNENSDNPGFQKQAKEFFGIHDKYMQYIPGYKEEFEKINDVR
jgi:hypothetical protein